MNKKIKITEFSDPGHGWIAVNRDLLHSMTNKEHISRCSYQKGKTVYLEEDCDAAKFFKLFFASHGLDYISYSQISDLFEVKKSYTNNRSAVRRYASYNPNTIDWKSLNVGDYFKLHGNVYFVESMPEKQNYFIAKSSMGQRFKIGGTNLDSIFNHEEN